MNKKSIFVLFLILFFLLPASDDEYLRIETKVEPVKIKQGLEGVLKLKIVPNNSIMISSNPELEIRLEENRNLVFSKMFFKASELDYKTKTENGSVFLDLDKQIEIPFKVNTNSLLGEIVINGEVIFTAVFKDKWSLKTYQKFTAQFISRPNYKLKKQ